MTEPREYLIRKGSYFYRKNCCGYTEFKFDAGRYTKEEAEREASVEPWHMKAIHQNDVAPDSAPDAFIAGERAAIAQKAREFAANYPQSSDGRNTFILFAEWVEGRS